jgi:hypothetical protein
LFSVICRDDYGDQRILTHSNTHLDGLLVTTGFKHSMSLT